MEVSGISLVFKGGTNGTVPGVDDLKNTEAGRDEDHREVLFVRIGDEFLGLSKVGGGGYPGTLQGTRKHIPKISKDHISNQATF